jgi:hypothetical protein
LLSIIPTRLWLIFKEFQAVAKQVPRARKAQKVAKNKKASTWEAWALLSVSFLTRKAS